MQRPTHPHARGRIAGIALAATLALSLAGCGSNAETAPQTPSATASTLPVNTPTRIVSLSPTATEMLYAIGAGAQVKAVDDQSNYPATAPRTKLSGYQPNAEAIAGYSPDLVVMSDSSIASRLEKLHIRVLVEVAATTLSDSYHQITELGEATGHAAQAAQVVAKMRADITALTTRIPAGAPALTYYHELDNTYFTVTSHTFLGQLYALAKLRNIADAADKKDSGGYPQLSAEYIVQRNPDLVFLADTKCCKQTAATLASRPGWNTLTAVAKHHVILLDDDIASRWGPRVVDLLRTIVQAATDARRS